MNDNGRKTVATMVSALMTLRLPAGDEFRVVTQGVLGLLADVPGVPLHPGYPPPVTVEILLRTLGQARRPVLHLGDVLKVVGVPSELLDAVGEDAEDLDEFLVHFRRGTMQHAQLNLAQPVVEREQLRPEAADENVSDQEQQPYLVCSGVLIIQGAVLVPGVLQRRGGRGVHREQELSGQQESYVVRLQPRRRPRTDRRREHGLDRACGQGERCPLTRACQGIDGVRRQPETLAELSQLAVVRVFQVEPEEPARLQMACDLARSDRLIVAGGVDQTGDRGHGRIVQRGGRVLWHSHRPACFLRGYACAASRGIAVDSPTSRWRGTCFS